ncbi:MAG: histidine kinase [Flavobacteriales bacterium]|nr:histidine kinase [Flavobacteriales bacterium]
MIHKEKYQSKKATITTMLPHIIVVVLAFLLPFSVREFEEINWTTIVLFELPIILLLAIFYVNYFWLVKKWFFKRKYLIFTVIQILMIGGSTLILSSRSFKKIRKEFFQQRPAKHHDNEINFHSEHQHKLNKESTKNRRSKVPFLKKRKYRAPIGLIVLQLIAILVAILIKLQQKWQNEEDTRKNAESLLLQAQLTNLSYQIQPHFFFNTLNTIHALIDISSEKAQDTLVNLSEMMRYVLDVSQTQKVPIQDEIKLINSYIDIMRLRLPEGLMIQKDFAGDYQYKQITPLVLIVLVENAFKHGTLNEEDSFLKISLAFQDKKLLFQVSNTFTKKEQLTDREGTGLNNLKERLELLYPDLYKLDITKTEHIFHAKLTLWI